MANNKAISDEQIIAALLSHSTVAAAGAAVGLSARAMYDRMANNEFKVLYKAAKADVVKAAVSTLNGKVVDAINTIADIMADKENNVAVRLQAATTILTNAGKFTDRLEAAEYNVLQQIHSNKFDNWNIDI